jgi:hypothetical protein
MGSSDLYDVSKLIAFLRQSLGKSSEFWKKTLVDFYNSSDVHDRGEDIV